MPDTMPRLKAKPAGPCVTRALLAWYDRHRRVLPWRALPGETPDPYRVWLSEVMLQQTTVAAVKPYFARFLDLWPCVGDLAAAPAEAVMREWAGLGYYARARNLHACAKAVAARPGGRFPDTEAALRTLPGIGAYTAAAVAAIAFGEAATVVDGNVERVVSRLFAIETPLPASRPEIRLRTETLVPADRPGDFAQAMMDLGATLCTPKAPACAICPVRDACLAQAGGIARDLPRRVPKAMRPERFGAVLVLRRPDGATLVRTRPSSGLLGGMTEFFGSGWEAGEPDTTALREVADRAFVPCGTVTHVFTHFALHLKVHAGRTSSVEAPPGWRWAEDLGREPLPSLMTKVLSLAEGGGSEAAAADPHGLQLPGLFPPQAGRDLGRGQRHGRRDGNHGQRRRDTETEKGR